MNKKYLITFAEGSATEEAEESEVLMLVDEDEAAAILELDVGEYFTDAEGDLWERTA